MNEFEFTVGSLESQGLQEGDKVECTYSGNSNYFTVGKKYLVYAKHGALRIEDDDGDLCWGHYTQTVKFKPVSVNVQQKPQGHKLQHILPTCKEGDVLECVQDVIITAWAFALLLIVLNFGVSSKYERDNVMKNCLGLGNAPAQCEKLFE